MRKRQEQQRQRRRDYAEAAIAGLPEIMHRMRAAEERASVSEAKLSYLKDKLINLLNADQLEAARVCGCDPEIYALEWIDIWRKQIMASAPVPYPQERIDLYDGSR